MCCTSRWRRSFRAPTAHADAAPPIPYGFSASATNGPALAIFRGDAACGELGCSSAATNPTVDVPLTTGSKIYIAIEETSGNAGFTLNINKLP